MRFSHNYPHSRLQHYNQKGMFQAITIRTQKSMEGFMINRLKRKAEQIFFDDEAAAKIRLQIIEEAQSYLDCVIKDRILEDPMNASIVFEKIMDENHKLYDVAAWSIMPNHVHLLLHMLTDNMSKAIQLLKARSARAINQRMNTEGQHLWERGYFSVPVQSDREFAAECDYILGNPKKCGCSDLFTGFDPDMGRYVQPYYIED